MCTCIYCILYYLYCVFVLFRLCISIRICTSVRTTATEWKLNCSNNNNNNNNNHTHDSQPLDLILSQIIPAHIPKPDILKIHFNIIIPSTPRPSKWSLTFVFYDEFCSRFSPPPFGLYARPSSHLNHLSPDVKYNKSLTMQLFPPSSQFLPLMSKYSALRCSSLQLENQVSYPHRTSKIIDFSKYQLSAQFF